MHMNNTLDFLVLHCTDTPEGKAFYKDDVIRWHTSPVAKGGRGWKTPGYSDMIYLDGSLVNLVPFNTDDTVDPWELTNGVKGLNARARHLVYVGGSDNKTRKPKDTRTSAQRYALEIVVKEAVLRHPRILVMGHYQAPSAAGKACPSFEVPAWLRSIGIPESNIFKSMNQALATINSSLDNQEA